MDGAVLTVTPVACVDRTGRPYEVTLELSRDGLPYGTVGERCGWQLARLAGGVEEARRGRGEAGRWPDPDDRFPEGRELFSFRYRAGRGGTTGGELGCWLRTIPVWEPRQGGRGSWRLTRRAFVEAWGTGGQGARAVLTSAELSGFVRGLVDEAEIVCSEELSRSGTGTGETR